MKLKRILTLPIKSSPTDVMIFTMLYGSLYTCLTIALFSTLASSPLRHGLLASIVALGFIHFNWVIYTLVKRHRRQNHIQEIYAQLLTSYHDNIFLIIDKGGTVVLHPSSQHTACNDNIEKLEDLVTLKIISEDNYAILVNAIDEQKEISIHCSLPKSSHQQNNTLHIEPLQKPSAYQPYRLSIEPFAEFPSYFVITTESHAEESDAPTSFLDNHIGLLILSDEKTIDSTNHHASTLLGYSADELTQMKLPTLFTDKKHLKSLLRDNIETPHITHVKTKDKEDILIACCALHTDMAAFGKAICFFKMPHQASAPVSVDNTNAKQMILNSPLATLLLDQDGAVILTNKAFEKLCKKKAKPASIFDIAPHSKQIVQDYLKGLTPTPQKKLQPLELKNILNQEMTASAYISPTYNEQHQINGYVCHIVDTTELKNLELHFVHSQKMQAVGQLAGGIAHDFNNLLTAMMGFCDLLLIRHPAGDPSFSNIMQIKQNANRAANLIRQLLAFSRKQTLQPKVVNMADTLADLSNLIGRLIGENILLDIIYGKDIGYVKVDQGQLEQVIINLAVNARDAMPNGGTLTIKTENITVKKYYKLDKSLIAPSDEEYHLTEGDYILIEISDTGSGIDKELLTKIFEPFFSTKEIGSGTGLGLSTVYGIIKQTEGYIFVSSKLKKGTTFHIFLKSHHQDAAEQKAAIGEKLPTQDLTGKGAILIVEDEAPVRMFSKSALINKGYTVIEAESGEKALEEVHKHNGEIDAIISDVIMPGMSGPDMIKQVESQYPDIKVIFTSGYTEDAFASTFGEDHDFNFLQKPYTLKQLASKVKNVLS